MQAKFFMEAVRDASRELKLLNLRRAQYLEMGTGISAEITGMPHNPNVSSRVETAAVGMADILTEIDVKRAEYLALIRQAEELIEKLPQYKFKEVLTLKYIVGLDTWQQISDKMGYKDKDSASHVHGYALRALQKLM